MIEIDTVVKLAMRQGIIACTENTDSTELERLDVRVHANIVVLGRNYCIENLSGKTAEVHHFSPEHEALKFPASDDVAQHDDPCSGETCMLLRKELLCVPAMKCYLILPF